MLEKWRRWRRSRCSELNMKRKIKVKSISRNKWCYKSTIFKLYSIRFTSNLTHHLLAYTSLHGYQGRSGNYKNTNFIKHIPAFSLAGAEREKGNSFEIQRDSHTKNILETVCRPYCKLVISDQQSMSWALILVGGQPDAAGWQPMHNIQYKKIQQREDDLTWRSRKWARIMNETDVIDSYAFRNARSTRWNEANLKERGKNEIMSNLKRYPAYNDHCGREWRYIRKMDLRLYWDVHLIWRRHSSIHYSLLCS